MDYDGECVLFIVSIVKDCFVDVFMFIILCFCVVKYFSRSGVVRMLICLFELLFYGLSFLWYVFDVKMRN